MNKNLIVEIFVPLRGANRKRGVFATGYPVARNLILTARHPLYPEKGRDEDGAIEVRWRHPEVENRWRPVKGIAWESEKWDLALLECELPPGITAWGFLSEQRPDRAMYWESAGFPSVGKKHDTREPFHMQGTVYSMLDVEERFAIAETAGPKTEEDWKGASGSPVFVNWRILGVIVSVPEKLEAARLWAVPMWRLLREEPAFREKFHYHAREDRRKSIQRRLTAVLAPAVTALDALAAVMPDVKGELLGKNAHEKAGFIAEQLLRLEVDGVIEACRKAYARVKGSQPDARAITEALHVILPAVYDHGVVEAVRNARGDLNAALVTLPAHYPTVAEIIMAGADRREALFCAREREDDFPKGRLNLPEPPEGGFDPDGQRALETLDDHLAGKFSLASAGGFQQAVDEFMVRRFYRPVAGAPERTEEQKIEGAAREIRYQAETEGRTHYLIVTLPKDPDDQAELENVLRRIRGRYRGLMCLSLNHDWAVEEADYRCFRSLLGMLPKSSGNPP